MKKIIAAALISVLSLSSYSSFATSTTTSTTINETNNYYIKSNEANVEIDEVNKMDVKRAEETIINADTVIMNLQDGAKLINATALINVNKLVFGNEYAFVPTAETEDKLIAYFKKRIQSDAFGAVYSGWYKEDPTHFVEDDARNEGVAWKDKQDNLNDQQIDLGVVSTPLSPEMAALGNDILVVRQYLGDKPMGENLDNARSGDSEEPAHVSNVAKRIKSMVYQDVLFQQRESAEGSKDDRGIFVAVDQKNNRKVVQFNINAAVSVLYKALGTPRITFIYFLGAYNTKYKHKDWVAIGQTPFIEMVPDSFVGIRPERYYTYVLSTRSNDGLYLQDAQTEGVISAAEAASTNQKITLSQFCKFLWRKLQINNEPVMPDEELFMLIAGMGKTIPLTLQGEEREAVKQLLARGIIDESFDFIHNEVDAQTLLTLLHRAKVPAVRMDFKKIEVPYVAEIVKKGYYYSDLPNSEPAIQGLEGGFVNDSTVTALENARKHLEEVEGKKDTPAEVLKARREEKDKAERNYINELENGAIDLEHHHYFFTIDGVFHNRSEEAKAYKEYVYELKYTISTEGKGDENKVVRAEIRQEVRQPFIYAELPAGDVPKEGKVRLSIRKLGSEKEAFGYDVEYGGGMYVYKDPTLVSVGLPNEFSAKFTWKDDPRTKSKPVSWIDFRFRDRLSKKVQFAAGSSGKKNIVQFNVLESKINSIKYDSHPIKELVEDISKTRDLKKVSILDRPIIVYDSNGNASGTEKVKHVVIELENGNSFERVISRLEVSVDAIDSLPVFYDDNGNALVDSRWLIRQGIIEYINTDKDKKKFSIAGPRLTVDIDMTVENKKRAIAGQLVYLFKENEKSPLVVESYDSPGNYLIDMRILQGAIGTYFVHSDTSGKALFMLKKDLRQNSSSIFESSDYLMMFHPQSAYGGDQVALPMYNNGSSIPSDWSFDITTPILKSNWFVVRDETTLGTDKLVIFQPRITKKKVDKDTDGVLEGTQIPDGLVARVYSLTNTIDLMNPEESSIQTPVTESETNYGIRWNKQRKTYVFYPPLVTSNREDIRDPDFKIPTINAAFNKYLYTQTKTKDEIFKNEKTKKDARKYALPIFMHKTKEGVYKLINLNINLYTSDNETYDLSKRFVGQVTESEDAVALLG